MREPRTSTKTPGNPGKTARPWSSRWGRFPPPEPWFHRFPAHAFLAPLVMNAFEELDVAITLWERGHWVEMHERADVLTFEREHGTEIHRATYNERLLKRACKTRKAVLGEHTGFCDWFVPITLDGRTESALVTGPIARKRATSAEVLQRWRALTGRQGHPGDPEFMEYLTIILGTLVLEPALLKSYQELVEGFSLLMAGAGQPLEVFGKMDRLLDELAPARFVDRTWHAARDMVVERTSRSWQSPHRVPRLERIGLERFPELVVVGLLVSRERQRDPTDELIACHDFQRAAVELASAADNICSGQVGDHGVTFLTAPLRASVEHTRRRALQLAEKATELATRFGFDLHLGVGDPADELPFQYRSALSAAETAIARGVRVTTAKKGAEPESSVAALRHELVSMARARPQALPARFDHFLEAVARQSAHRLDLTRLHLEVTFERLSEALLGIGVIQGRAFAKLTTDLGHAAPDAATPGALFSLYRRALEDLLELAAHPEVAARDHSLQRAEEHMRRHYAEKLRLEDVARVAGFAPDYFSKLFRRKQQITFERYLSTLRVTRARQLLSGTSLNLERIAELTGFSCREYLGRTFRRITGETPMNYRTRSQGLIAAARKLAAAKRRRPTR